ncbi:unannotated protein [freshwater metagenome]|uniref:Unannotated protein n=1 Tax=freshwater metagenome TaxID=449393 RepID=A0A6J6FV03_9ZZZZ
MVVVVVGAEAQALLTGKIKPSEHVRTAGAGPPFFSQED